VLASVVASGKSTILRSVAAAALLGSVGLAIPAAAGSQLPLLDAVMLRTFTGDAPQDGLSAFAVEMKEMRWAGGCVGGVVGGWAGGWGGVGWVKEMWCTAVWVWVGVSGVGCSLLCSKSQWVVSTTVRLPV